jgi:hypothetical protein
MMSYPPTVRDWWIYTSINEKSKARCFNFGFPLEDILGVVQSVTKVTSFSYSYS